MSVTCGVNVYIFVSVGTIPYNVWLKLLLHSLSLLHGGVWMKSAKKMAPGKQCSVCERRSVDVAKPNGLSCTYCGSFFHSECSSTFSEVSEDILSVVKKVCTPCPNCHLPMKVPKLEQRFVEFVAKTEASFSKLSHVPNGEIRNVSTEVAEVGKAVKEAISAQDNKQCVIVSGVVESGSTDTDLAVVKELFGFLSDDRVIPITEAFRLGKGPINGKPRLLKVRLSNATQRSALLQNAKHLKDSEKFKEIFVRPSYTAIERALIRGLYDTVRTKKNETGMDHYIYRRGPVSQWSVKMRQVSHETPSQSSSSVPGTNLPNST